MSEELSKEYLLLFNAISTTIDELEAIKLELARAQQDAEAVYLERTE